MVRALRPEILNPLFAPLVKLPGVGPRTGPLLSKLLGGEQIVDLLWHLPSGVIDRRFSPPLDQAGDGVLITTDLTVVRHEAPADRRRPYRIYCLGPNDEAVILVFFHARGSYLKQQFPEGEIRVVSGKVDRYRGDIQITHPDRAAPPEERDTVQTIEPIYPLTKGITGPSLLKAMSGAMERVPDLPEWIDAPMMAREGWPTFSEALQRAHKPEDGSEIDPVTPYRRRLAFDELLSQQLALGLVRAKMRQLGGRSLVGDGALREKLRQRLPFSLTGAQERSLTEIEFDLAQPGRMLRLLQGDVGSGKTMVALISMLSAVEAGHQAVLMAPTEILARQHYETIAPLIEPLGLVPVVLTGRDKGKAREMILKVLADGTAQIAIGTHALFQDSVDYQDLALAVIDEQHRFGVQQRITLSSKGKGVDVLVMTATPIPRTLTLTAFGDMEVSRLDEKPPGRQPVDTRVLPNDRLPDIVQGLERKIEHGAQIYWVCPLVSESEEIDLAAAEERHRHLSMVFGDAQVGLVHGKMKGSEKDDVMSRFSAGDLKILVATTVIEVGVNVPNATIMVIEHAERFGLAQLHQLRGRVGRGTGKSTCLLVYGTPISDIGKERLRILRETEDGFIIAEKDLELRGGGEVLGTRQSGSVTYRLADLAIHGDLAAIARKDTNRLLETDPDLTGPRGEALRTLLYLFERDAAVRFFRSG